MRQHSLTSDVTSRLPPLRLANGSKQPVLSEDEGLPQSIRDFPPERWAGNPLAYSLIFKRTLVNNLLYLPFKAYTTHIVYGEISAKSNFFVFLENKFIN